MKTVPFKLSSVILSLAIAIGILAIIPTTLVPIAYAQSASSTADAVQLIRNYYRWINQTKYQRAFNIWENARMAEQPMAKALKSSLAASAIQLQ